MKVGQQERLQSGGIVWKGLECWAVSQTSRAHSVTEVKFPGSKLSECISGLLTMLEC